MPLMMFYVKCCASLNWKLAKKIVYKQGINIVVYNSIIDDFLENTKIKLLVHSGVISALSVEDASHIHLTVKCNEMHVRSLSCYEGGSCTAGKYDQCYNNCCNLNVKKRNQQKHVKKSVYNSIDDFLEPENLITRPLRCYMCIKC